MTYDASDSVLVRLASGSIYSDANLQTTFVGFLLFII